MTMPDEGRTIQAASRRWAESTELIREFLAKRPHYEQLCGEVAYIVGKSLKARDVPVAAITTRAKELDSFMDKVERNRYDQPLREVTDFAGARIVYPYQSDRDAVEEVISSEFDVIERTDTLESADPDRFGYAALHCLVRLSRRQSGARYDELKGLVCEIQVRSILQDAWANVAHHISYKQEAAVPKHLRRKLNSLAGLFETADDQIDRLRSERLSYVGVLRDKAATAAGLLDEELNLDTLEALLQVEFPALPLAGNERQLSTALNGLLENGIETVSKLAGLLESTRLAREAMESINAAASAAASVNRALDLVHKERRNTGRPPEIVAAFADVEHLVGQTERSP